MIVVCGWSFNFLLLLWISLLIRFEGTGVKGVAGDGISDWWKEVSTSYPKYDKTTKLLQSMEKAYPDLVKIYSVGKSVQGKDMWVVNLRSKVKSPRPLLIPPMKIVANMHGDETVGRALVLMLAVDLVQQYNKADARVKKLLDSTDIHLLPSVNPDGFEVAQEGICEPNPNKPGRRNANSVDLNRDFPDQFEVKTPNETAAQVCDSEPEAVNMMKYIASNYFVLSANFHGGAVVACYPFDSVPMSVAQRRGYTGSGVESLSPDNDVVKHLAKNYADNHKTMKNSVHQGSSLCRESFPGGFINGAYWYNVRGGMQDFNYAHSNCFEITVELSCCKFPKAGTLITEWDNNKESMYQFLEATHMGIKGVVKDNTGKALEDAEIIVEGRDHHIQTTNNGEYWRLLLPGKYKVSARAEGYAPSQSVDVDVEPLSVGNAKVVDFTLSPGSGSPPSRAPFQFPVDCDSLLASRNGEDEAGNSNGIRRLFPVAFNSYLTLTNFLLVFTLAHVI